MQRDTGAADLPNLREQVETIRRYRRMGLHLQVLKHLFHVWGFLVLINLVLSETFIQVTIKQEKLMGDYKLS